jgi:hypothetical protein
MESSYLKLYKNSAIKQNKAKYNKSRQNPKQPIKKNKSLTYYHYDGQTNYINKFQMNNELNNTNKKICNNNNTTINQNNTFYCYNNEYNDTLLLAAYKKSVSELFKTLKALMGNELYKYDKIKREFLHNIQKYYNDEKNKDKNASKNKNKTPNNIKSYSKQKIKERSMKQREEINYSKLHKNNSSLYNTSLIRYINKNNNNNSNASDKLIRTYKYTNSRKSNQIKDFLIKDKTNNDKSMNTSNISGSSFIQNQYSNSNNYNSNHNFNSHINHQSLFTLLKAENNILVNSPTKNIHNYRNDNIMKKFVNFSKNITGNKNIINKTCSQSFITNKKLILNNNYKNNDDCKVSDTITKNNENNELITKIKDSLDDNLKHIFNFSYENFLNKESERDFN